MARGARIRGVERRASRFKKGHTDALWANGREIAHTHNGQVDVRLTRAGVREIRDELRSDARIDLRGPGFDWILVRVRNRADVDRAMELLRRAIKIARAQPHADRVYIWTSYSVRNPSSRRLCADGLSGSDHE